MAEQGKKPELNMEEALSSSEAFIIKNKKGIIGAILAIIIIIAGVMIYKHYISDPKEAKAAEAIFKGEEYFGENNFEIALKGDSAGYIGFIRAIDEYSGTKSGKLAKAYAGLCYAQLGKYEDAIKYLSQFEGKDQMVSPAVLGTLGDCYAQMNQLDQAASTLMKAAEKANNSTLSPIYLMKAGNIYEKQGKYEDAIQAYTSIKDKYFDSYQAMNIDKYIDRAKVLKK